MPPHDDPTSENPRAGDDAEHDASFHGIESDEGEPVADESEASVTEDWGDEARQDPARSLDGEEEESDWGEADRSSDEPSETLDLPEKVPGNRRVAVEYVGDAEAIGELPLSEDAARGDPAAQRSEEASLRARRIGAELKQLEADVRAILDLIDPRRKRKLSGTRRWHELQDDILQWRFTSRMDEASLQRLGELVARRHYLFRQLSFFSVTRPTWNS